MTIERPAGEVYAFVCDPNNLPAWASGLSAGVDSGPEVYMPMRVLPNGEGAEVLITVFRQPGVSDEKFAEDTHWVRRDLEALKTLLEK
jgi:hypothetical protein